MTSARSGPLGSARGARTPKARLRPPRRRTYSSPRGRAAGSASGSCDTPHGSATDAIDVAEATPGRRAPECGAEQRRRSHDGCGSASMSDPRSAPHTPAARSPHAPRTREPRPAVCRRRHHFRALMSFKMAMSSIVSASSFFSFASDAWHPTRRGRRTSPSTCRTSRSTPRACGTHRPWQCPPPAPARSR